MLSTISTNLHTVRTGIESAALAAERAPAEITLIAVSKTHPVAAVQDAYRAGQRHFGENYLQDALEKVRELAEMDICWHFIGRIQSNKTRSLAAHFDWVHTVDRLKIAQRLSEARLQSHPEGPPLNLCLQVNIDADEAKAGLTPDAVPALASATALLPGVRCRGLMTILSQSGNVQQSYAAMKTLYESLDGDYAWDTLSMGMSDDYREAIAHGSTMIRVGTAIFGPRNSSRATSKSGTPQSHNKTVNTQPGACPDSDGNHQESP